MSITLLPAAAVDRICHDEQMTVWSSDFAGALSIAGYLRDDLDYDDVLGVHEVIQREIRSIIRMALDHPEARTIYNVPKGPRP